MQQSNSVLVSLNTRHVILASTVPIKKQGCFAPNFHSHRLGLCR